jgi:hypothetical protein
MDPTLAGLIVSIVFVAGLWFALTGSKPHL